MSVFSSNFTLFISPSSPNNRGARSDWIAVLSIRIMAWTISSCIGSVPRMVNVCVIGSSLRVLSKVNLLRVSRDVGAVIWDMEVVSVRLFKLYYCYNLQRLVNTWHYLEISVRFDIKSRHSQFALLVLPLLITTSRSVSLKFRFTKNSVSENKLHPQESRR